MNLVEMVQFSINSLWQRKLRSFLTVLGIIIGISSLILLVGLVQGLKVEVLDELDIFGPRTILILPVNPEQSTIIGPASSFIPTSGKLSEKDYARVKRLSEIKSITKMMRGRATIVFKDQAIDTDIFGVEPKLFEDLHVDIDSGRFLEDGDRYVTVVGSEIAERFDEDVKIQSNLYMGGRKFRVVGTLKPTGSTIFPVDSVAFIPFEEFRDLFNESLMEDEIDAIRMILEEGSDVDAVADEVEMIMLASHRVTEDEKDFGVISPAFINSQFVSILDLITIFLGAIASISLIVGGIGISNTMFMSVMERRREIGTMKAVGAPQSKIRNLFLVESSIIGLLGGVVGVLTAVFVGLVMINFTETTFVFEPFVMTGTLLFSIAIGTISGTLPAMEAARLEPMVALRYE